MRGGWGWCRWSSGSVWALATPAPDLLVTGDGRHLAVRTARRRLALLRDRAGDYARDMLGENGGVDGEPLLLAEQPDARCSRDLCAVDVVAAARRWRIAGDAERLSGAGWRADRGVPAADIVVSERGAAPGVRAALASARQAGAVEDRGRGDQPGDRADGDRARPRRPSSLARAAAHRERRTGERSHESHTLQPCFA